MMDCIETSQPMDRLNGIQLSYPEGPASQTVQWPRRAIRATRACDSCRQRKQKCDEGTPCLPCEQQLVECTYREKQPSRTDKSMESLLTHMENIQDDLRALSARLDSFRQPLDNISRPGRWDKNQSSVHEHIDKDHQQLRSKDRETQEWHLYNDIGNHRTGPNNVQGLWVSIIRLLEAANIERKPDHVLQAKYNEAVNKTPQRREYGHCSQWPESRAWSGLKSGKRLDLDTDTIHDLYERYRTHIHVMHPFLDLQNLELALNNFIYAYGTDSAVCDKGIEMKPINAIILLVLALGKICSYKRSLQYLVNDGDRRWHDYLGGPASPITSSSETEPRHTGFNRLSTGGGGSQLAGMELVPGMAYFVQATKIIGAHTDGTTLSHAQMFILAGIYKAQLNRVTQSRAWYSMAGHVLLFLLDRHELHSRPYHVDLYSHQEVTRRIFIERQKINENQDFNRILLAAWTSIQLESEILAELNLPSSDMHSKQDSIMWPQIISDWDDQDAEIPYSNQVIMISYIAQLYMLGVLKKLYQELYGEQISSLSVDDIKTKLEIYTDDIVRFRNSMPNPFAWEDDDPLAADILSARIRDKYWTLVYLVHRPFLDFALHVRPHSGFSNRSMLEITLNDLGNFRPDADIHLFEAISLYDDGEVLLRARRCLHAAMASTIVFDGLPDRLNMINIHGTAHAQFTNILVLASAYQSYMRDFIDGEKLRQLFARTIQFLHELSPMSRTCVEDMDTLEKIQKKLFPM